MARADFGKRIKKRREQLGITPSALAKKLEVSLSTYLDWENGRQIRGEQPYIKLARELDMTLNELMTGERNEIDEILETIDNCVKSLRALR